MEIRASAGTLQVRVRLPRFLRNHFTNPTLEHDGVPLAIIEAKMPSRSIPFKSNQICGSINDSAATSTTPHPWNLTYWHRFEIRAEIKRTAGQYF
eukprot:5537893-Pleurochrysis_carterae.AAC.3